MAGMHRAEASTSRATSYVQWSEYFVKKTITSVFLLISSSSLFIACSDSTEKCSERSKIYVGSIDISEQDDSNALEDLECVQVVTGDVSISDPDVESLETLSSLAQVQGNLEITGVKKLSSLKGLEQLTDVGGNLVLRYLPKLETLEGLGSVKTISGGLSVGENDRLTNIQGLYSLIQIGGEFQLNSNPKLTSATFHAGSLASELPTVGSVYITENESLKTLKWFGAPHEGNEPCYDIYRASAITIRGNDRLEEVTLPTLENVCVYVWNNLSLKSIFADETYPGYGVNLGLVTLPKLKTLEFDHMSFYSLTIQDTGIETLDGLNRNNVSCNLEVNGNPQLKDISVFNQDIGLVAGNFNFSNNPALRTCEIQAVASKLPVTDLRCLTNDGLAQGARSIEINGNNDNATCE
jgi:hypothetical protein